MVMAIPSCNQCDTTDSRVISTVDTVPKLVRLDTVWSIQPNFCWVMAPKPTAPIDILQIGDQV